MPWVVLFYVDARGREPVREWLDELQRKNPTEWSQAFHERLGATDEEGGHMTTWHEYKKKSPLRGEAKRAYDAARKEMGVGYLILKARAAAGLSQTQLAKKIGTSQPMIARWESGAQLPSVSSLLRIAGATGFDLALALQKHGSKRREFQIVSSGEPSSTSRTVNHPQRMSAAKRKAV